MGFDGIIYDILQMGSSFDLSQKVNLRKRHGPIGVPTDGPTDG